MPEAVAFFRIHFHLLICISVCKHQLVCVQHVQHLTKRDHFSIAAKVFGWVFCFISVSFYFDLGEYGYVEFNAGATDSRTYQLDLMTISNQGFHCLKFYYFFSDNVSDASIEVFNENSLTFENETIGTVNSTSPFDRWNEARFTFENNEPILKVNSIENHYQLRSICILFSDIFFFQPK